MMWIWFCLAVVFFISELITGTYYLLLIASGFASAGVVAKLGGGLTAQIVTVFFFTAISLYLLYLKKPWSKNEPAATQNANVNMDIGQFVEVEIWSSDLTSRVIYRGAAWDARLLDGVSAKNGRHRIHEVQGSVLILVPVSSSDRNNGSVA